MAGRLGVAGVQVTAKVALIVVGFRNPTDIADCLRALSKLSPAQSFEVLIVENGGDAGMSMLLERLDNGDLVQRQDETGEIGLAVRPASKPVHLYRLVNAACDTSVYVRVAQAPGNLGYGGGINFWLRPLLDTPGWTGIWVLNPDTMPTPQALAELKATASRRGKGMVGSCLVNPDRPGEVATRGLKWNAARARVEAIGRGSSIDDAPDLDELEIRLWAPSGASFYVTRALIEQIGLVEERYFLYFEDLEWGMKARHLGQLTHAHNSIVVHKHGTTIGSNASYRSRSPLSEYLESRNIILFVRAHFPRLLWWAVIIRLAYIARYGAVGVVGDLTGQVEQPAPVDDDPLVEVTGVIFRVELLQQRLALGQIEFETIQRQPRGFPFSAIAVQTAGVRARSLERLGEAGQPVHRRFPVRIRGVGIDEPRESTLYLAERGRDLENLA